MDGADMTDKGRVTGRTAGILAVVVIAAMVAGVGWIVSRVASPPKEASAGVSYELRGESGVAGSPTEVMAAARVFLKDQKAGASEKLLARAIEAWPDHQGLRFLYGETLLTLERKGEAYNEYERGIMIGPDHAEYRHAAGTLAADMGLLEDAEGHYLVAQKLAPENAKHPLYLAQVQRAIGKTDEARASLVLSTKLDPDLAIGWGSLAGIALEENRLSVARTYIARAREVEPENVLWRLVEARIERRDNNPEGALEMLLALDESAIVENPDVVREIALCYGLLGEPGSSAQWYVEAVASNDENADLMYEAAQWLERSGQIGRAIEYAHNASLMGHEGAGVMLRRLEESRAPSGG